MRDIAWTYVLPRPESTPIAGQICFYNEIVDIDIDGERQPDQNPTSNNDGQPPGFAAGCVQVNGSSVNSAIVFLCEVGVFGTTRFLRY